MTVGEMLVKIGTDLSDLDKGLDTAVERIQRAGGRLQSVGTALSVGLTAPLIGLGLVAVKASSDFETAMTNVAKTTNATDAELAIMSQQFKNLSERIPASAVELANVAANAAQLGIQKKDILNFTRVMTDMGVATNLSAEDASTALAQLANVTKMSADDFDNLGSTIVALGNEGASTEAQITFMSQRIAGAGHQIGLTSQQILGFSAALADTGIEVEAGGSAMSRIFIELAKNAELGGTKLNEVAKIAGMTGTQFKQAFEKDAGGATVSFITGLGNLEKQGKSAIVALDELGLSDVRVSRALLNMAANSQGLNDKLALSNKAWAENTALTQEAERFYATSANQLKLLGNEAKNVASELGDSLIPVLKNAIPALRDVLTFARGAASAFALLPDGLQRGVVGFVAILAAIGPVIFIIGSLIKGYASLMTAQALLSLSFGELGAAIALAKLEMIATTGILPALRAGLNAFFGLVGAGGLILLAIITTIAAVMAVMENWKVIVFELGNLWDKFAKLVVGAFDSIKATFDKAKGWIGGVTTAFGDMFNAVVGHSYVPDMISRIQGEFAKLNAAMVLPARAANQAVVKEFANTLAVLTPQQELLIALFDREHAVREKIKSTRLDLMFTQDADEVIKLNKQLSTSTSELNMILSKERGMDKIRVQLTNMAAAADDLARAYKKINDFAPHLENTITGTDNQHNHVTMDMSPGGEGAIKSGLDQWVKSLTGTTSNLTNMDRALIFVESHAMSIGSTFASVGKSVLSGFGGVVGKVISMFNPLTIISSALDEAFRNAGASLEPFTKAIGVIANSLLTALQPVIDSLVPVFEQLAPIIAAVGQVFGALFKAIGPLLEAMIPILRALFPLFKFVAVIVTYLGQAFAIAAQVVLKIAAGIAIAVGTIIKGIFGALSKIPLIGGAFKPIANFGSDLIDLGKGFNESANDFSKVFDALGQARDEIQQITLDAPIAKATANLDGLADSAHNAAGALGGTSDTTPGRFGQETVTPTFDNASVPSTVSIQTVAITTSGDGQETYRNFYNTLGELARSAGPAARNVHAALPVPG